MLKVSQIGYYENDESSIPSNEQIISRIQEIYQNAQQSVSIEDQPSAPRDFVNADVRRLDGTVTDILIRAKTIKQVLNQLQEEFPEFVSMDQIKQVLSYEMGQLGLT